jgi:hypothetical protein
LTRTGTGFLGYETADGRACSTKPKFGDSALLAVPLAGGGAPRPLVDCVRRRTIVYVACAPGTSPPLRAIDTVTGRDLLLGTLEHFPPDTLGIGLAVSPDGKSILFRGLMRRGGDLMLIENFR